MSALLELAARCEAATGPDRELDCRISLELSGIAYGDSDVSEMLRYRDEPTGYGRYRPADEHVAEYTASLDAAMTLAPEGWIVSLSIFTEEGAEALLQDDRINPVRLSNQEGSASIPALALCAAALRARATGEQP